MEKFIPRWLVSTLILVVTLVWAAALARNIYDRSYVIPDSLQVTMTAVVTALLGNELLGKEGDSDDKPGPDDPTKPPQ